ncbi:MAG: hypothetical protein GX147_04025 [Deltaproteobacteria bacterium]|nr:hypothetical protein [Deltaproteobacteria bacterium]
MTFIDRWLKARTPSAHFGRRYAESGYVREWGEDKKPGDGLAAVPGSVAGRRDPACLT